MKINFLLLVPTLPFVTALTLAAQSDADFQPSPRVVQAPPASVPNPGVRPENQRLYGPSGDTLIAREVANNVLEKFRQAYATGAAPRLVIYVNRELVDTAAGMKLTGRTENYEKTTTHSKNDLELPAPAAGTPQTQVNVAVGGNVAAGPASPAGKGTLDTTASKTSGTNTYAIKDSATPTLADKQTVREVERLFGRAFRNGGAKLADQKVAATLLDDKAEPHGRLIGDHAAKDRAALASIADIAIEVLISSRNLTVPEVSGDKTHTVPDIQATAIRLKDSAIVGQASASDVLGKDAQAGRIVKQFDVRDITEATALALMEDMLTGAK
jgi:hypothetical protein